MKNYKQYKHINNLRKFDLGSIPNSGRQTTALVNTSAFSSTPGYTGYSSDANAYTNSILPQTLNTTTLAIGTASSPFMMSGAFKAAEEGGKSGLSAGWSSVGAAASYVASAANAIMGGIGLANALGNYSNRIGGSDIQNMSSHTTQTKYGQSYDAYGGVNSSGVMLVTNALNRADNMATTTSAAQTGMGIGGAIGTAFSPIGTLVGTLAGGLLGGIGGAIFGHSKAKERRRLVRQALAQTSTAQEASNTQSESEAGSKGLRSMYAASTYGADAGKKPGQSLAYGDISKIETPQGSAVGPVEGLASPDEGMIDMATGDTKYMGNANPSVKDPRADIIPVGGGSDFNNNVAILGHTINPNTGNYFADDARQYFKENETLKMTKSQIDSDIEANDNHKTRDDNTKRFMRKKYEQMSLEVSSKMEQNSQILQDLVKTQITTDMFNADKGKMPKFDKTKSPWWSGVGRHGLLSPLLGLGTGLSYSIAEQRAANANQPYAANAYVENPNSTNALRILGNLRYNPNSELQALNDTASLNRYAINNAGNLSAGQKMMLTTAANNDTYSKRAAIQASAANQNNTYKQAYANALAQYGEQAASRAQQALAAQQDMYAKSVGAKQRWQAQARKNYYTSVTQGIKDWNSAAMFNRTADLYDAQLKAEREAAIKKRVTFTPPTQEERQEPTPYSFNFDVSTPEAVLKTRQMLGLDCGKNARRFDGGFTPFSESITPEDSDAFRTNWINQMAMNSVNKGDFDDDDEYYNEIANAGRAFGRYFDLNKNKIFGEYDNWTESRAKSAAAQDAINEKLLATPLPSSETVRNSNPDAVVNDTIARINENVKKQTRQANHRRVIKKPTGNVKVKSDSVQSTQQGQSQDAATSNILSEAVITGKNKPAKRPVTTAAGNATKPSSDRKKRRSHYNHSVYEISAQSEYNRNLRAKQERRLRALGPLAQEYMYADPNRLSNFNVIDRVNNIRRSQFDKFKR